VQGSLEGALLQVTGSVSRVIGAGRTDTGVHATGQVAHFDTQWKKSVAELAKALNAVLPYDVAVLRAEAAPEGFHARHSALSRIYEYRLWRRDTRSPMHRRQSWHVPVDLDVDLMRHAGAALVGTHDFGRFGRPTSTGGPTVRRLERCAVHVRDLELVIEFEANAFLRHQVRRMTGMLVDIGRGGHPGDVVAGLLNGTWQGPPPRRAPAQGLVLREVTYPSDDAASRWGEKQERMK
jgi:tRNA pseudouridine38-40 synthase